MAGPGGCQEVAGLLQGAADGALPAAEREAVAGHAASCPACAKEMARLSDNSAYLKETLSPFRMPQDFSADFLFTLAPKDQKRRPAPAAPAAPRSTVMGDTRDRGPGPMRFVVGGVLLVAAGGLAWLFFGPEEPPPSRPAPPPVPEPKERPPKGKGPGDPVFTSPKTETDLYKKEAPRPSLASTGDRLKNCGDLVSLLRGVKGDAYEPIIRRGWDLLAGNADEARAAREIVGKEKDAKVRAALALCIGADASEENRAALVGLLTDESPEVRAAAALGLARSLSFESPQKKRLPSGPPLNTNVDVGLLPEGSGRAEISARLGAENETSVRRVLLALLGPTAPSDPAVRDRLLEGVKGAFGEEAREAALKALHGIQDASLVAPFTEALGQHGTSRALQAALIDAIAVADRASAGEAFANLLASAEGAELRRDLVNACGKVEGEKAGRAVLQVLSNDQDASVRLAAVQVIQKFPSREAMDAAQRAAENDSDQGVRQAAEVAAKHIKGIVEKAEGGGDNPPPADGGGGDK